MDGVKIEISKYSQKINIISNDSENRGLEFQKIQEGKYAETFLKFLAEKYQEPFDGKMKGWLANDNYLSNDEIELIIENHLTKNNKDSLEKSLHQIAQNKFDNLEKLAYFSNFVNVIPVISEGLNKFIDEVNSQSKRPGTSESVLMNNSLNKAETTFQGKQSNINLEHLNTFFANTSITKRGLDSLIQGHCQYPQRLITAIEEQFFPSILLPNHDKKSICDSVKQYIKTMSNVVQSGAILLDKLQNRFTYIDKVDVLENTNGQIINLESAKDLSAKMAKKGKGITIYQDHNIMYSLLKNFGKNFSQSFQNNQFQSEKKLPNLRHEDYELRKVAVDTFVQKLEKIIGKQAGTKSLKDQKYAIAQGKFSEMIQINGVEARFYLVKKEDKYLVSLLPKSSESQENKARIEQKNKSEINLEQIQNKREKFIKIKH